MGKEWYWSRPSGKEKEETPGCMGSMLHLFDIHQLLFSASTCTRPQDETSSGSPPRNNKLNSVQLNGLEAPRNSLELDDVAAAKASTSAVGDDDYYDIPYGVQLVPAPSPIRSRKELRLWVEEERRSSQAVTPRTTNVVAQLMGLEIQLDEVFYTPTGGSQSASLQHSPKVTAKKKVKKKQLCDIETPPRQPLQRRDCNIQSRATSVFRSLPETPRASSERYWDVDRRLSLQLNKENNRSQSPEDRSLPPSPSPYMTASYRRKSALETQDEINKSPRCQYNAREIVKQVKESVSRRGNIGDSDEVKSRSIILVAESKSFTAKPSPSPSRSPPPPEFGIPKPSPPPGLSYTSRGHSGHKESKCQKVVYERYTKRIKRHTPQPPSRPSLNRKEASHQRSPEIVPHTSCTLAATQEHKQLNASTKSAVSSQKSNRQRRRKLAEEQDPEFHYVRSVLERSGIMGTSQLFDPSVFHGLELDLPLFPFGPFQHRCNRMLLFHLVQEILGELVGGSTNQQQRRLHGIDNEVLLEKVWSQIRSFPSADCQAIGDIDVLVLGDLTERKVRRLLENPAVVAEAECVTLEIERDVLDSIVGEAADSLSLTHLLKLMTENRVINL